MIDSHVHLNHQDFATDLDDVVSRALEAGVTKMVNIGFDLESSLQTADMVEKLGCLYGAVGVHPHDAETYDDYVEGELERLLGVPGILAVGEIGLDFYRDLSPRDVQASVFRRQLDLARRCEKPIIIHCRDAFPDVIDLLSQEGSSYRGIFHAFTGDESMARRVLDLGFHIGIGGVVTFKNAGLGEVVARLPLDRIVLETDCPYLTPAPYRGKRNEPAYLTFVVEKISSVTGKTPETIVSMTNENFGRAMQLADPKEP